MVSVRVLLLLCVAIAVVLSESPGVGITAEPLDVVKVHVVVHQKEVGPAEHVHKHPKKKDKEDEGVPEDSETVRNYDHGTVRIDAKDAKAAENGKEATKQTQDHETGMKYKHGSVKIFGEKNSVTVDSETKSTRRSGEKADTSKEQAVTSTANDVNELLMKGSSTSSAHKKSSHDTFGPVVIICGVIVGLAAIIGVAGLAMNHSQPIKDSLDSDDSAELDVDDIEANIASVGVQDEDSDSDVSHDKDEEESSVAIGTAHVSV